MTQISLNNKRSLQFLQRIVKSQPHWIICILLIIVVSIYWGLIASNRYVSTADLVISIPQISSGAGDYSSGSTSETRELTAGMLLQSYVDSADMVQYLTKHTDFLSHYSSHGDFFSTLGNPHQPLEKVLGYYQRMVSLEPDEYTGIFHFRLQAFTPEESYKLANVILQHAQLYMNEMAQQVSQSQVDFLKKQSTILEQQYHQAQQDSLDFENAHGLAAPTNTLQSFGSIISQLQGQLASLRAQRASMASFQSSKSPDMIAINSKISAIQQQINEQQRHLTSKSGSSSLNAVSAEYQTLQMRAQFALQAYSGVLTALENARVASASQTIQISYIQKPTLPQFSEEPRRLYNITVFSIVVLFAALIINMLILIVRDHKN